MSSQPLVSVIIAAYNASGWIAETLSSVVAQEYDNYEVIVVNDGSTDDTEAVVALFGEKVHCINKSNGGEASARNKGIRAARGKYLAFVDADDLWTSNKLRLQVGLLESSEAAWVYSDAFVFDGLTGRTLYKFSRRRQYDGDILRPLLLNDFIPSPTPVIRRSVFDKAGLFDERAERRIGEDWDMWLRIAALYPVAVVRRPLAYYRLHSASATSREDPMVKMEAWLTVVEEAVSREPRRLGPIKNRALSRVLIDTGRSLAGCGQTASARKVFFQAMGLTPCSILPYLYWGTAPVAPLAKKLRYQRGNR